MQPRIYGVRSLVTTISVSKAMYLRVGEGLTRSIRLRRSQTHSVSRIYQLCYPARRLFALNFDSHPVPCRNDRRHDLASVPDRVDRVCQAIDHASGDHIPDLPQFVCNLASDLDP